MAKPRAIPPDDIPPEDFFLSWVPARVADDEKRRSKLEGTSAAIVFALTDADCAFTVHIDRGEVRGASGASADPDLRVELDVDTWRALNRGDLAAPQALLARRLRLEGDFPLALKLHLILG